MKYLVCLFLLLTATTSLAAEYVDVVVQTGNLKASYARLKKYINVAADDEGNLLRRVEESAEHCMTPPTDDGNGNYCYVIRMEKSQADKLPKNDTPNFSTSRDDEEGFVIPEFCGRIAK